MCVPPRFLSSLHKLVSWSPTRSPSASSATTRDETLLSEHVSHRKVLQVQDQVQDDQMKKVANKYLQKERKKYNNFKKSWDAAVKMYDKRHNNK